MLVETSLAESLMNAVTQGRVHGFQLKRGFGMKPDDERLCFESLQAVIAGNIDGAKKAAREQAHREVREQFEERLRACHARIAELDQTGRL